ncbi:MAG: hypothetical protein ABEN55_18310, partial [Bradymonadaceae bacterium]
HERDAVHPPTISSWFREATPETSAYHMEFDWTGTDDPTPWLCVPTAIDFLASLHPDGWPGIRQRNHQLAREGRDLICEAVGVDPPAPDQMLGTLASIPLPDRPPEAEVGPPHFDPLQKTLVENHGFEVPVFDWPGAPHRHIRISAHLYNRRDQYQRLASVLKDAI